MKMPGGLQSGVGRRVWQPIHTNDIDPGAESGRMLRRPYAHFFYSSRKRVLYSNIKSSQGCFDELGGIWDEWAISVSFSFKTAAD